MPLPLGFRIFRWIALISSLLGVGGYLGASAIRYYYDVRCNTMGANSGTPWLWILTAALIIGPQLLVFKNWAIALDVARGVAIPTCLLSALAVWDDVWDAGLWPGNYACVDWSGVTSLNNFNDEFLLFPTLLLGILTYAFLVAITIQCGVWLVSYIAAMTPRESQSD